MTTRGQSITALTMSTLAFTVCFAVWMLNGVLVTFLVENRIFNWSASEMGLLIGAPVLTGSVVRLPIGLLTDRYGGRPVFTALLALSALPTLALAWVGGFGGFLACSLGFGIIGGGFAVGIAFTSVWFSKQYQGTAMGVFGAGNAGAAITTLGAPGILRWATGAGQNLDGWRTLPKLYAVGLVVMAVVFYVTTTNKLAEGVQGRTVSDLLSPLKKVRVWRFGLYYFLVFGGFVALAQWLVPYYVNVYAMSLVTAGLMASIFSGPSGVIRALGGYLSDRFGARPVLVWVLVITALCSGLLFFPKMDIESPGRGVMATRGGSVTAITDREIRVGEAGYPLKRREQSAAQSYTDSETLLLPVIQSGQEPTGRVGEPVVKKQLLARGVTHIYFQANVWIFTFLVFVVGIAMGIGKAAVYRYIPDYYPKSVGVVGGMVGVLGGLGGFFCPVIFGFLLDWIGLWTTTWMFLFAITAACIVWLTLAVRGAGTPSPSSRPPRRMAATEAE